MHNAIEASCACCRTHYTRRELEENCKFLGEMASDVMDYVLDVYSCPCGNTIAREETLSEKVDRKIAELVRRIVELEDTVRGAWPALLEQAEEEYRYYKNMGQPQ